MNIILFFCHPQPNTCEVDLALESILRTVVLCDMEWPAKCSPINYKAKGMEFNRRLLDEL